MMSVTFLILHFPQNTGQLVFDLGGEGDEAGKLYCSNFVVWRFLTHMVLLTFPNKVLSEPEMDKEQQILTRPWSGQEHGF